MSSPSAKSPYAGYRFPPELINHAVWLYFRFPLSLRMVEEMLAVRGIIVSHETVRQWALKFGQDFANRIRRRLPCAGDKWHLDEVAVKIAGKKHCRRINHKAFRPVFRQFVLLCRELGLFGKELLAIDGTRIKAVNNKDRNFTRASLTEFIRLADAKLEDYLKRLDHADAAETSTSGSRVENLAEKIAAVSGRRDRCQEMLAELDRTGESQISLTDPDSRAMAARTRVAVGYNAQIAVDTKHKLIVEQQVTNQVLDMGLLTETAEPAKEILGVETIDVVADKGYFKIEDIEACEKAGMQPYVPRPQRGPSVRKSLFRKDEFKYDPETDSFTCPAGQRLTPYSSSALRQLKKINYANRKACRDCPLRARCTDNQFRTVSRLENEAVLDRMAARLALRPGILGQRREAVEHPFGTIKQWMYQGAFLMRGLEKVRAEFSLTALAYNIRRVLNLVTFDKLMVAMKAAPG